MQTKAIRHESRERLGVHMNVLIACEFSGVVREAFRAKGHNAVSCDLLPTDIAGPHIQDDVLAVITGVSHIGNMVNHHGWDLMIAHPPCDHLAVSGASHFKKKREDGRQQKGIDFFMALVRAGIPKICIENPVGIMSTVFRKPNQIIQPWWFGHNESKKTCLWLMGLEKLKPTRVIPQPECGYRENQTPSGQNKLGPSKDRWKLRSKTYQGIADAMADQWG